jgi:addiction module HigA family antidote
MTADTACRLGRFFGTTPEFWMNLQTAHDLSRAVAEHDYSTLRALESA